MYHALTQPFVSSDEGLKALFGSVQEKDGETIAEKINEVLAMMHAAQHNQAFGEKAITMIGDYNGVNAGDYKDFVNELEADMNWMQFFRMIDATGANRAEIFDFNSVITWDEYEDGEKINFKPLGSETYAELRARRFAVGVQMLRRWLSTNARYNVNDALEAIRIANMSEKSDFAYNLLFDTTGVTTVAFNTDVVTTLNDAADALIQNVAGSGFNISADQPLLLLANGAHRASIQQALETVRSMGNGSEIISEYNIRAVYSYNANVTTQIAATDSAMLVVPGFKNVWATFDPVAVNQEMVFSTDSVEIQAQEYWNAQAPAAQRHIVNLTV